MAGETRRLLKIFGVAVTDFEAEAEMLQAAAAQLSAAYGLGRPSYDVGDVGRPSQAVRPDSGKDQIAKLLKDVTELCRELNTRWLETTQHIFAIQKQLLSRCADAASGLQSAKDTTEIESARMEAGE